MKGYSIQETHEGYDLWISDIKDEKFVETYKPVCSIEEAFGVISHHIQESKNKQRNVLHLNFGKEKTHDQRAN